jgi:hypothetical protein
MVLVYLIGSTSNNVGGVEHSSNSSGYAARNEILWDSLELSVEELQACFPECNGLVMIKSSTRQAVRPKNGKYLLEDGVRYNIPLQLPKTSSTHRTIVSNSISKVQIFN